MKKSFNQVFFFCKTTDHQLNFRRGLLIIDGELIYKSKADDIFWILYQKNEGKKLRLPRVKKHVMHNSNCQAE